MEIVDSRMRSICMCSYKIQCPRSLFCYFQIRHFSSDGKAIPSEYQFWIHICIKIVDGQNKRSNFKNRYNEFVLHNAFKVKNRHLSEEMMSALWVLQCFLNIFLQVIVKMPSALVNASYSVLECDSLNEY